VNIMQADGLPFAGKFFLLLAIFALGFLLARDLFFIISGPSDQKNSSYAAADYSPAPVKTKVEKSSSKASAIPTKSKAQDPIKNFSAGSPKAADQLSESGNGSAEQSGPQPKTLRADEGTLPVGDLRKGADAKPMGGLRSPAESGVTGSLRPDERSLPTGSLRPDEGSLPMGNLR
jgi:hypothetical protein